ncbi:MAG: TetR/AcrR family transcriptional regulator [Actinobacteria bacterium]|nr:TetR/AcrR family transcriptional regulator [Actinomycetota bacterium]
MEVVPVTGLTAGQQARRERVVAAALELAAAGGYESVQMRDVSTKADVALGTIYRYFSSKDHLLAAAMADLTGGLHERVTDVPPKGASAADRLVDVYRRATRALERQPKMTAALITALSSPDAGVNENAALVRGHIAGMAEEILDDLDPRVRDDIVSVLGHVFYSTLTAWAHGRHPFSHVMRELERAIRLVVPQTTN